MMEEDNEGFFFPLVDAASCVECGLCSQSCPELILDNIQKNEKEPLTYALINNQDKRQSSSGGAFSAFSRHIIAKGGVVYGAVLDKDGNCCHHKAETLEELTPMRGSKYLQSSVGFSYREIKNLLQHGRWVLFSGTPCQVAGLKTYVRKPYERLLTIDIACHGVPSNRLFLSYIAKLRKSQPAFVEISDFKFRQFDGWSKSSYIKIGGNSFPLNGTDNLYMEAFNQCAIFRKSCYQCKYARIPRQGDITIADFWGIGRHGHSFRHDTQKGVSLVLVNTDRGQIAMDSLNGCVVERRSYGEAIIENPNIYNASHVNNNRDEIVRTFLDDNKSLQDIEAEFHLVDKSLKGTIKRWALKFGLFDAVKNIYDKYRSL